MVLAACPLLVLAAARIVYTLAYRDSEFFTFWRPAHELDRPGPYVSEQWLGQRHELGPPGFPTPVPYPLPLATLLAPLGLLRLDVAYIVWVAVSLVLLVVGMFVILLRRPEPRLKHYLSPSWPGCCCSGRCG